MIFFSFFNVVLTLGSIDQASQDSKKPPTLKMNFLKKKKEKQPGKSFLISSWITMDLIGVATRQSSSIAMRYALLRLN